MRISAVAKPSLPLLTLVATVTLLAGPLSCADDVNRREFSESRPVVRTPPDLDVKPARGQTPQQRVSDLNECHARAVARAGYDPNHASTGFQVGQKRLDYDHALSTCLQGRGYTLRK